MNARRLNSRILLSLLLNVVALTGVAAWSHAVPVSAPGLFGNRVNSVDSLLPIDLNSASANTSELFNLRFDSVNAVMYAGNSSPLTGSMDPFNLWLFDPSDMPFDAPRTYAPWLLALDFRVIPEPRSLLLLGLGLLVLAVWGRRHYQHPQESESNPLSLLDKRLGEDMKTILVVDDNSTLRYLMSLTLQSMGYKPIMAANGTEGVERAIVDKPDLMLLDVMLPDINGPQVAEILRHKPVTKDIPIIAISAAFGSSLRQACLTAGCNDFIPKPFTSELLGEKLRSFITMS